MAPWGGLLIDPTTLATGAPGVFAAGDVTYGPKSIILAAAHGRKAAQQIHAFLRHLSPPRRPEMPEGEFETASTLPAGRPGHARSAAELRARRCRCTTA